MSLFARPSVLVTQQKLEIGNEKERTQFLITLSARRETEHELGQHRAFRNYFFISYV